MLHNIQRKLRDQVALQPIDLSTIYSQMDKVGQFNASQTQGAAMANRSRLEKTAQEDTQKANTVQQASKDKDSNKIKADVSQGGGAGQTLLGEDQNKKGQPSQSEEELPVRKIYEFKDPNAGQHIDITG